MKRRLPLIILAGALSASLLLTPVAAKAQQPQQEDGAFFLGSIVLSLLHFPLKLATCVGTQTTAAVAYVATYDVRGHYDGGTNGRDIGETARRSCTGNWLITPQQVKQDYGD